jgi:hypothetical protein
MNGIASLTTAPLPTGVYQFTASYGGDVNNTPSSTAAAIVVTAKTTSSTSLAASAARIDPEQTVTLTMTVSGQSPTGTVSIFDNGVLVGTAALTAGTAVFTTTELGFGFHNFTVRYDGDANNFSSTIAAPTVVAVGNVEAVLAIILMLLDD